MIITTSGPNGSARLSFEAETDIEREQIIDIKRKMNESGTHGFTWTGTIIRGLGIPIELPISITAKAILT